MVILAGPPGDVPVPASVAAIAEDRRVRPAWRNQLGGITFEIGDGLDRCFVKWAPRGSDIDLAAERDRLCWAQGFTAVPEVLGEGADDDGEWLVLRALPGRSAVDPRWRRDPRTAVSAIGAGLRRLHEALPVDECPFTWEAEVRVATATARARTGLTTPGQWFPEHQHLTTPEALGRLSVAPAVDRLVVCHGDACAPNTILSDDGSWLAHVDLGALGLADRWADLAIATWSTTWNYGPGWEDELLDAYGVEPDPERTAWYRLLWDLT